jgi:hypothetical protein
MVTMTRIDVLKTKNIMAQEFTCHSDKNYYDTNRRIENEKYHGTRIHMSFRQKLL